MKSGAGQSSVKQNTKGSGQRGYKDCDFCAKMHQWGKQHCPAYGKTCNRCGRKTHFAVKCQSSSTKRYTKQKGHNVEETKESDSEAEFVMTIAQNKRMHRDTVAAQMEIVHSSKFQIDTVDTINAIPRYLIPNVKLQELNTKLKSWCSTELKVKGSCRLILRNPKNRRKYSVEFFVVDCHVTPVLGKRACESMGLVRVNYGHIQTVFESDILTEFKDVFNDEIGTLPGDVHLAIDSQASPVAIPSCRVPVSITKM